MVGGSLTIHDLCVGSMAMKNVVRWTEPADLSGQTHSTVTYLVNYDDLPAWASDDEIRQAFSKKADRLTGPFEIELPLVQTNEGWRVNTQFF